MIFSVICQKSYVYSLFALVSIGLRYRLSQFHFKFVTTQRHLLVMGDQGKECIKYQVVSQVELGAACLLTRVDTTVLHPPRAPVAEMGGMERKIRYLKIKIPQTVSSSLVTD